ncbi:hypothetical protein FF021_02965 [Leptospira noguchii]|nr:hypothetical protein FF021_02965 [Leptospira noguchii]
MKKKYSFLNSYQFVSVLYFRKTTVKFSAIFIRLTNGAILLVDFVYQIECLNVYYKILFYVSSIELNAKGIDAGSIN